MIVRRQICEHQNQTANPHQQARLAQLADFDATNPDVLDYLAGAYEHWIGQGADAFRIDTIAWMPTAPGWSSVTRMMCRRYRPQ